MKCLSAHYITYKKFVFCRFEEGHAGRHKNWSHNRIVEWD